MDLDWKDAGPTLDLENSNLIPNISRMLSITNCKSILRGKVITSFLLPSAGPRP